MNPDGSRQFVIRKVTTSIKTLKDILDFCFKQNEYQKPDCLKDFLVASLLMQSKINVIVLLAGTSGTGKSTLASLLGTRLGISTVLSTDSIRHIMRNFLKESENKVLFCSTYEAGKQVSAEERQDASENWITLKGYKQ
jgi:2-phosphoglycerate kinase